tara:strand:+ start:183 stop:410 length:228 start_codon:yes stop_codon:yes gene_type:complete
MNEKLMMMIMKNGLAKGNLVGVDGNAFSVLGYTERKLKRSGWSNEDVKEVMGIAMSSDYNNLLTTCVSVLEGDDY